MSSEPSARAKRIAWFTLLGATIVLVPLFLALGRSWQNDVRDLMGIDRLDAWQRVAILVVTVLVAVLIVITLIGVETAFRALFNLLGHDRIEIDVSPPRSGPVMRPKRTAHLTSDFVPGVATEDRGASHSVL